MGVSSIKFWDFAIGHISYIFMSTSLCFIGCSLYTAVDNEKGGLSTEQQEHQKNLQRVTFIIEIIFTVIVTIVIGYVSKNILEKKL